MTRKSVQLIATRTLELPDQQRSITVCLGKPRKSKGRDDYTCEFYFDGWDNSIHAAVGMDQMQALQLALRGIHLFLAEIAKETRLLWDGTPELGFS
jgi:hypothetical protein